MKIGLFVCSVLIFLNCQSTKSGFSDNNFQAFDRYFSMLKWTDTLDSKNTDWALGHIHEVNSPRLPDSIFYAAIDTAKMNYKFYDAWFYAEGKIDLPNQNTGYFLTRQMEDITYDRTTLLLVFDKNKQFVQDIVFSEFIGYEGFITETQSKLFKNEKGFLQIESVANESYYDAENQEYIEKTEKRSLQFAVGSFQ